MNITQTSRSSAVTAGNIPVWRQLRWNLVGFAVALVVIPVVIVGIVVLQQTRTQTLTQINYQLDSITTLKDNQIERWLSTSNQVINVFLSDRARADLLSRFANASPDEQAITGTGVNSVLLNGIKSQGENNAAFKEFFLYDLQGRIVASSDEPQIGKVVNRQPYFNPSLLGDYTQTPYYDVGSTELTMFITRPLINTAGDIVGAMAGRLDLTTLGNIMTERAGLGESGETYLISIENNYFLTPSRFQNIDQNRAYHTEGIDKGLSGETGFGIYPDYRGIPVLGIYRWVPELKAAFLAEIDEAEAFALYNQTLTFGILVLILATLGATLVAFYNATRVSKPISALTEVASQIASGDFSQRAEVSAKNEIGVLAVTFNSMSDQLQNLVGTLEERVNARTRDLQIVANVSKSATTILNLDDLLQSVVDLTKQSFDLYHAHIYLVDETNENLVLRAGAGEPGRIMKAQGRRIALNNSNSLVARAGRTRKGVIENDVTRAPDFLPNPLLPDTKSELAVPMVVGNRLIGVLDVQANYANRFTDEDVAVQTSLGDQIAVAVQNASSFQMTQSALEQTETLYAGSERVNRAHTLTEVLAAVIESTALKQVDRATILFFDRPWEEYVPTSVTRAAEWSKDGSPSPLPLGTVLPAGRFPILHSFKRDIPLIFSDVANDLVNDPNARDLLLNTLHIQSFVVYPLVTNDQWVGVVVAESHQLTHFNDEQVRQIGALVGQASNVIGNIQLVEQTQKRADELETVASVSTEASTNLDVNDLLWTVANVTKERFNRYHAHIYLIDDNGKNLVLAAGAGDVGRQMVAQGHRIPMDREQSLVARAARTRQGFIVDDVRADADFLPNKFLTETRSEMAIPMIVGDTVIGVLDIQDDKVNAFSSEQLQIKQVMAAQIAIAIQNARAFADVQDAELKMRANQEELLEAQRIARVGRWTWLPATGQVGWNDMMYEHFGEPHHVAPTFDIFMSHVHPDDAPRLAKIMEDALQTGAPGFSDEYRIIRNDGQIRYHSAIGGITRDENGAPIHLVGTAQDITERKGIEAERQIVYDASNRLNQAQSREQVLEAILPYAHNNGVIAGNLFYVDVDANSEPEWAELVAEWAKIGNKTSSPVGSRFYLPEFAISKLWMSSPNEPLLIGDLNTSPAVDDTTRGIMKMTGVQAMAILPMVTQGRWIAFISFTWSEIVHFSDQDRRVYTSMMQQATATVDALRSAEETEQARQDAETLYRVSTLINEVHSEQDIVNAVVQYAIPQSITSVSLNLNEGSDYETAKYIEVVASWRRDGTSNAGMRIPLAGFNTSTNDPRAVTIINDIKTDLNPAVHAAYAALGVAAIVTIPLTIGGRLTGSLSLSGPNAYHFSNREIQMWRAIGEQTATTIERLFLTRQTTRRAAELETVAQVSAATTSMLDIDEMLLAVTNLTKDSFGLYHAHVYLLDEAGQNLVLAAGAGEPGSIMKAKGHSIPINHPHSIVAHAASTREGTIANDVTQAQDFLPNPLLPNTKSELAVPMILGDKLVGVFDLQSDVTGRFSDDDVRIQGTLADQIAVAVENARAFTHSQQLVADLQTSSQLVRIVIDTIPDWIWVKRAGDYRMVLANKSIAEQGFGSTPEYITNKTDVELGVPDYILNGDPERGIRGWRTDDDEVLNGGKTLYNPHDVVIRANDGAERIFETTKIPLRDQTGAAVGVVGYARDVTERKLQEEEQNILYEVSRAMSNARTSADVLESMAIYVNSRGATMASLFHIDLEEGMPMWLEMAASISATPSANSSVGSRYYMPEFPFAHVWMQNPDEPTLIANMQTLQESDPDGYSIFIQANILGMAVIPLRAQDRWLGLISLTWNAPTQFTAQDERILTGIMRQATSTLDAIRASAMTAKRAAELQTVAQVSAAATMVLEVEALLQSVVDLTKESFDLYHAHVYLMDDAGTSLVLTAGAGEPGRIMKEQGRSISLNHQNSLVARAARNRDGAIANDVTLEPDFLPNPLLPDTRSEMAIPLIVGDQVIGVLDVQANTINRFTADDVAIQSTLADQIAVAVQNARTFKASQETAERLREVDRLKSQFLANMSHELRTPLNSIIGYAEVLLDGIDGDLSDEAVEDVEAIHGGGKHLLTIINDILDLAKIEAGQMFMDRQDANLNQAVDEAVNTCQILAKNKNIGLNVEIASEIPHVFGDPIRLKQIIFNLVNNAIKFTEKGAVTVNLGLTDDNTQVVVAVHDSGMGMTEEDIAGLFQQFHQVDGSATRRAGGTGLGLVITRHLVHMHEGEIYVESEKGVGSTFWFTLPVYTNQPRQKA